MGKVKIWKSCFFTFDKFSTITIQDWERWNTKNGNISKKFNCFKSVGLELCVPLARTAGPNFSAKRSLIELPCSSQNTKMLKFFYICENPLKYVSTMTRNIAQATTDPSTEFSILIKSVLTRSTTFFKPQTFINANSRQYLGENTAFRTSCELPHRKLTSKANPRGRG